MSTKTSIKRIALVAVAGLGFGMTTGVSANAANLASSVFNSVSLAQVTATPTAGAAVEVNFGADVNANGGADSDTARVTGYLSSYPAGGFAQVTASATAVGTDGELFTAANAGEAASGANYTITITTAATALANDITASSTAGAGKMSFTPSVAGSYVMSVWNDADADGVVDIGEAVQTISLTVAAAAAANTTPSATYSSISAWDATSYSKVAGTDAGTAETITVNNTANAALNGQTVRAVVTGPGVVTLGGAVTGRDVSLTLGAGANTTTLLLEADGNSGKVTVDVYAGTTKLLTTAAVTFYGTLATLKVTQNKSVVAKNVALVGAITISGLDAEGIAVPLADDTVVGTSSDTTVLATKGNGNDSATDGVLTVSVTGANDLTTTSGRTATITWKYLISGTTYTPEVVNTFAIGGAMNSVAISFDDTNYAPGSLVTATITAKDASGNPSADGQVIDTVANGGGLSSSLALQGLTTGAISTVGGKATTTFYAPAVGSGFTVTAKYTDASAAAQTATASATLSNVAADAVDAANEATDAANAATDAANAAAEAADAATAAAQDAQAAVAALATSVASLIAGIKAQITTLTNLVIKIQKKVKA